MELLIPIFRMILLISLLVCAVATALSKKPMTMIIIFTAYSIIMSVVWVLLRSPDLAITEAAVGAGVTSLLFFVTLKKIHAMKEEGEDNE